MIKYERDDNPLSPEFGTIVPVEAPKPSIVVHRIQAWQPYTQQQLDALIDETIKATMHLMKSKGAEYAHGSDRLDNFRRNAADLDVPPELVWMVYARKHWDSITTYVRDIKDGKQRDYSESIEGRFDDMINYCLLGKAMVQARKQAVQGSLNFASSVVVENCNATNT